MQNRQTSNSFEQTSEPYASLDKQDLILRDFLAADRTHLANERTFLAYIRTALALFGAGVTLVHFFDSAWLTVVGWAFVPFGITTLVIGAVRYERMKKLLRLAQSSNGDD